MRISRVAALCSVAALLLVAVIVARGKTAVPGSLQEVQIERGLHPSSGVGGVTPSKNAFKVDIVDELRLVQTSFVIIAMILLLVAFAALIRRLQRGWRRRPIRVGVGVDEEEEEVGALESRLPMRLRRAAAQARAELTARAGGPPGDAVVAAWLRLEEAAANEGAGRRPHQTATEFTTALLAHYTTSEPALDELRRLYQRARFGPPGQVTEVDAAAAVAALDRILRALAAAPAAAPELAATQGSADT
jgi:uncharacterized protein DUF4129